MGYLDKQRAQLEAQLEHAIRGTSTPYGANDSDFMSAPSVDPRIAQLESEISAFQDYQTRLQEAGLNANSSWNEAIGAGIFSGGNPSFNYNRQEFGGYDIQELRDLFRSQGQGVSRSQLYQMPLNRLDQASDYLRSKENYERARLEADAKSSGVSRHHFLGNFAEEEMNLPDWLADVLDPPRKLVKNEVDPILFGEPGKDNVITSVEGGGIVDDPYIHGIGSTFFPYVGMALGALNKQSDYEHAKEQGYTGDWLKSVVGPTVTNAATSYVMGNLNRSNPYGYGTSNLGKAATTGTTAGLNSYMQGSTGEQAGRNAAIAGVSNYAGSTAGDYFDNPEAGKFTEGAANLGLSRIWEDPEAVDYDAYYQNLLDTAQTYNNQTRNNTQMPSQDILSQIQNTPEGSQLMALFDKKEDESLEGTEAGGSGQYGRGNDQLRMVQGQEGYLT